MSADEIQAAANRLSGIALRTPLVPLRIGGEQILVKAESLQPTGAFKLRGAYAAISALPSEQRNRGVVTHSSGNHAHAVAYAAATLGVPATVVVPSNAPAVKVAAASSLGATVVYCEPNLQARVAGVEQLVSQHGFTPIPPFDDAQVIAGQGTVGLEIAADCPDVDLVVCPVGGGGLISGVAAAIKAAHPAALIVGVEPEFAADARDSLRAGHRVAWPSSDTARTIADALRVEQIGELPMSHISRLVHDILTVSDEEIFAAMRSLATSARLVAEPGGAVAVAACICRAGQLPKARHPVAILSGGNVDSRLLAAVLTSADSGVQRTPPPS
ncbi:MAG TPA: threonine/serine dehydratase [Streptosporangiaceae bacterium]|nr:threonine/serine dehydratase [Streptosporangiaceae bacterium]